MKNIILIIGFCMVFMGCYNHETEKQSHEEETSMMQIGQFWIQSEQPEDPFQSKAIRQITDMKGDYVMLDNGYSISKKGLASICDFYKDGEIKTYTDEDIPDNYRIVRSEDGKKWTWQKKGYRDKWETSLFWEDSKAEAIKAAIDYEEYINSKPKVVSD